MRLQLLFLFKCLTFMLITGCNSNSGTGPDHNLNGMAVLIHKTGTEDVEILQGYDADEDVSIRFCYEEEGCESGTHGSTSSWSGPTYIILERSDPDKIATGVIVGFQVGSGEGYVEVIEGESYVDDSGFSRFEEGDELYTSDSFVDGDIVTFTVGDTD